MELQEKAVWLEEESRIVSFHPLNNSKMILKAENLFWDYLFSLTEAGYRVM